MKEDYANRARERQLYQQQLYRQLAIEYLGGVCQQCGSMENLQIHHKNGNWKDNSRENLVLLCRKCHLEIHQTQRKNSERKEWIYVGLPAEIVKLIDEVVNSRKWGFRSRSEFVLESVKMRLKDLGFYP